jgi:hypothetical protein
VIKNRRRELKKASEFIELKHDNLVLRNQLNASQQQQAESLNEIDSLNWHLSREAGEKL